VTTPCLVHLLDLGGLHLPSVVVGYPLPEGVLVRDVLFLDPLLPEVFLLSYFLNLLLLLYEIILLNLLINLICKIGFDRFDLFLVVVIGFLTFHNAILYFFSCILNVKLGLVQHDLCLTMVIEDLLLHVHGANWGLADADD
jgi:hypothetical protein